MLRVKLETSSGAFVVAGHLLPFLTRPDVVFWGERVFRFHADTVDALVYREAFCTALVHVDPSADTEPPPA